MVEQAEYNMTILTLHMFAKALGISLQDAVRGLS